MNRLLILTATMVIGFCSVGLGGCQVPPMRGETPAANDADFFMNLAYKDVASLGDGYRAVALLQKPGSTEVMPTAQARDLLVERNAVPRSWDAGGEKPLTKGELAYMICQSLEIKGGVTMRVFGPSQRYCLFEAAYQELMLGGATDQYVTGGELVSTIDRADRYLQNRQQGEELPAASLDAEQPPVAPVEEAVEGDD